MSGPPQHKRGPWSSSEDDYLRSLVNTQGPLNWVRISNMLGTRTPKQCRERYHQNLKPSLNHSPITAEEGEMIERFVREKGKRWAEIARQLHGRSDNAVKNWWNGSQNRRKRQGRRGGSMATTSPHGERHDVLPFRSQEQQHLPQGHGYGHGHGHGHGYGGFGHQQPPHGHPVHGPSHGYNHHGHNLVPRTLPMAAAPTARPPPASLQPLNLYDNRSMLETPLSSPSVYSPDSEMAPSLMSDYSSHYSTSPQTFGSRSPKDVRLAPLQTTPPSSAHRGSPDTRLPSLSALVSFNSPHAYLNSPELRKAEMESEAGHHHQHRQQQQYPQQQQQQQPRSDYFSGRPYPLTAPNSPVNSRAQYQAQATTAPSPQPSQSLQHHPGQQQQPPQPGSQQPQHGETRDEKSNKLSVADLVH